MNLLIKLIKLFGVDNKYLPESINTKLKLEVISQVAEVVNQRQDLYTCNVVQRLFGQKATLWYVKELRLYMLYLGFEYNSLSSIPFYHITDGGSPEARDSARIRFLDHVVEQLKR